LADDTTLILESGESICKDLLHNFELIAKLKTNMEKRQAFMIGKHMKLFKNDYNLNWTDGPIHILRLQICKTEVESIKFNFEIRIRKIRTIFNMWKQRHLSLKGKGTVINSPTASILVYSCNALDTPENIIKVTGVLKLIYMTSKIKSLKD